MSIGHTLLGLLEAGPRHGFDLKQTYDSQLARDRSLHYGQVYSTLQRLLRNGMVSEAGTESGDGPERKRYAITADGVTDVENWLATAEDPEAYLQNTFYTKVVLALLSGRSAAEVLDVQRTAHLKIMRTLTARKSSGDPVDRLICDRALCHLEADLRPGEASAVRGSAWLWRGRWSPTRRCRRDSANSRCALVYVSPALQRLLNSDAGAQLRPRFPEQVLGTIGKAGLHQPNDLSFMARADAALRNSEARAVYGFGGPRHSEQLPATRVILIVFGVALFLVGRSFADKVSLDGVSVFPQRPGALAAAHGAHRHRRSRRFPGDGDRRATAHRG